MERIPDRQRTEEEMELLLDQLVQANDVSPLPRGFSGEVQAARPFAPWEVRHRRFWKVPVIVFGLLGGSSALLGLAPLFRLGPGTALRLWAELLAAALVRPVAACIESVPLLAAGLSKAVRMAPGSLPLIACGALLGLIPLVLSTLPVLRRRRANDAAGR